MKRFLSTLLVSGALAVSLMSGVHAQQSMPQDQINNTQMQSNPINPNDQFDVNSGASRNSDQINSGSQINSQGEMNGTQINSGDQNMNQGQNLGATYPTVRNLRPFSAEANYMSLPGYLRFLVFQRDGVWMDRQQAAAIVNSQIATGE